MGLVPFLLLADSLGWNPGRAHVNRDNFVDGCDREE